MNIHLNPALWYIIGITLFFSFAFLFKKLLQNVPQQTQSNQDRFTTKIRNIINQIDDEDMQMLMRSGNFLIIHLLTDGIY